MQYYTLWITLRVLMQYNKQRKVVNMPCRVLVSLYKTVAMCSKVVKNVVTRERSLLREICECR